MMVWREASPLAPPLSPCPDVPPPLDPTRCAVHLSGGATRAQLGRLGWTRCSWFRRHQVQLGHEAPRQGASSSLANANGHCPGSTPPAGSEGCQAAGTSTPGSSLLSTCAVPCQSGERRSPGGPGPGARTRREACVFVLATPTEASLHVLRNAIEIQ